MACHLHPILCNLGCCYHLNPSHRFLSTWGVVRLEKNTQKAIQQIEILENIVKMDRQLATYRHKIAQVFQLTWYLTLKRLVTLLC